MANLDAFDRMIDVLKGKIDSHTGLLSNYEKCITEDYSQFFQRQATLAYTADFERKTLQRILEALTEGGRYAAETILKRHVEIWTKELLWYSLPQSSSNRMANIAYGLECESKKSLRLFCLNLLTIRESKEG